MFVLDSSMALAMLLPDEQSAAADALAGRFLESSVPVPTIWPLEVRNALLSAFRQKRLTAAEFAERLGMLPLFPVEVAPCANDDTLERTVLLARRYEVSVYDASYLDLAKQLGLPLATLDARLRGVCKAMRIPVLP